MAVGGDIFMSKNIEEFAKNIQSHFKKSKNSILEIGIRSKEGLYKYSWNNNNQKRHFGLGSVSKTILSTYICKMVKDNEIDLDKTIDQYLPLTKKRRYPTILQLLTHTSGYHAFIPFNRAMWVMLTNGFNKKNIYTNVDKDWLLHSVNKKRPFKKRKYRYSDYNYAIIAMIIEQIKSVSYKTVIIDFLQNEMGMKDTYYASEETTINDSYSWFWEAKNPFLASGGMFSTIDDMIKFLDYQISHQNELQLSHDKYQRTNLNKNVFTGFSWNSFYNGKFYWHIGGEGAYRSYALFDLKKDISIIILATVDIDLQHISRLGSSLYRNVKRNHSLIQDYLESQNDELVKKKNDTSYELHPKTWT
jgi:CubicO group peptidase (beta-lactamase class C family)